MAAGASQDAGHRCAPSHGGQLGQKRAGPFPFHCCDRAAAPFEDLDSVREAWLPPQLLRTDHSVLVAVSRQGCLEQCRSRVDLFSRGILRRLDLPEFLQAVIALHEQVGIMNPAFPVQGVTNDYGLLGEGPHGGGRVEEPHCVELGDGFPLEHPAHFPRRELPGRPGPRPRHHPSRSDRLWELDRDELRHRPHQKYVHSMDRYYTE